MKEKQCIPIVTFRPILRANSLILSIYITPSLNPYLCITGSTHNVTNQWIPCHGSFTHGRFTVPLHIPIGCRGRLLLPTLNPVPHAYFIVRVLRIFPRTLRLISTPMTSLIPPLPELYSSNLVRGRAFVRASYTQSIPAVLHSQRSAPGSRSNCGA